METLSGQCHCGNIKYKFQITTTRDALALRACSCSYCSAQGAVYSSDHDGQLAVKIQDETMVGRYQFASKASDFIFCKQCGVMPFVISNIENNNYAVVNINTLNETLDRDKVNTVDFANEAPEVAQQRRRKHWIAKVTGMTTV